MSKIPISKDKRIKILKDLIVDRKEQIRLFEIEVKRLEGELLPTQGSP